MESKPLNTAVIALTEKKMDMTLEDIIKMGKKSNSKGKRPARLPIKRRAFQNGNTSQGNSKVQQFMESRSSVRQGVLAQRRSSFQGNQFPVASRIAKRAAAMPIQNRFNRRNKPRVSVVSAKRKPANGTFENGKDKEMANQRPPPRTMDALFAQMQQQRMTTMPQQANVGPSRQFVQRRHVQQRGGRGPPAGRKGAGRPFN